jgi:Sgf11 (transcriptional regulation protein)
MPAPSDHNPSQNDEGEERVLQSIYDHVLRSVVVNYASNMHELIKTGGISASELQTPSSRHETFPDLYRGKSPEEVQSLLDEYATEQIPSRQFRKRKLRQPDKHGDSDEEIKVKLEEAEEEGEDEAVEDDDDDEDFKDDDDDEVDDDEEEKQGTAKSTPREDPSPTVATGTTQSNELEQQPPGVDIWGRIPPKEPKHPVECTLCGRHISTSRFASHLEKCMGISSRPLTGIPIRNNASTSTNLK